VGLNITVGIDGEAPKEPAHSLRSPGNLSRLQDACESHLIAPLEAIVQVTQHLLTKLIAGAHCVSLFLEGFEVSNLHLLRDTRGRKILPELSDKRLPVPAYPYFAVDNSLSIHRQGSAGRWKSFALASFVSDDPRAVAKSRSRSLQRALASRDMTVTTGQHKTVAISS
jgi:hypothetical protein